MTYESDAAERLRLEIRTVAAKSSRLQEELAAARASLTDAPVASERSEAASVVARQEADLRKISEHRTAEECGMLRRALDQALAQMQVGFDGSAAIVHATIIRAHID